MRSKVCGPVSLNEFSLLSGIPAVDYMFTFLNQSFDARELLLNPSIIYHFDSEILRNDWEIFQFPEFPVLFIIVGLFECAKVTKCPADPIAIPLPVAVLSGLSSENLSDVFRDGRFFGDAEDHELVILFIKVSSRYTGRQFDYPFKKGVS
jgi:hypothetical protein